MEKTKQNISIFPKIFTFFIGFLPFPFLMFWSTYEIVFGDTPTGTSMATLFIYIPLLLIFQVAGATLLRFVNKDLPIRYYFIGLVLGVVFGFFGDALLYNYLSSLN
jgi:hypothetical protein